MNIKKIKIEELKPAKYNPRKISDKELAKLKKSITEFGYCEPIIINKDMTVIGGHQRLKVLIDLKHEEAECVVMDLSKKKEKALNIALNKISGEFDIPILKEVLLELDTGDFDMELTGFDELELDDLFGNEAKTEVEEDDFDSEAAAENIKCPVVKLGDCWTLGKHKIICGDSLDPKTVEKLMGGVKRIYF